MENITQQVAQTQDSVKRQWHAIDLLIGNAPINCHSIKVEITPDGHRVEYFTPSPSELGRFSYRSVHGEWIK